MAKSESEQERSPEVASLGALIKFSDQRMYRGLYVCVGSYHSKAHVNATHFAQIDRFVDLDIPGISTTS